MGASPEGVAISQGTRAVRDFFYMIKRARLLELSPARQRDNGDCRAPRSGVQSQRPVLGQIAQPHPFESVVDLQVSKTHLDTFALVTCLHEGFGVPHQPARYIPGIFVDIAWNLARGRVGAALQFERTCIRRKTSLCRNRWKRFSENVEWCGTLSLSSSLRNQR
jgi:hypothetical protein